MTLIQDGNQIQSKMVNTGVLDLHSKRMGKANKIDINDYEGFLPLQT